MPSGTGVPEASFLHLCPFGIQGVDQYNEAGPLIYHLLGNVIAFFSALCLFCHWVTFRHSKINVKNLLTQQLY